MSVHSSVVTASPSLAPTLAVQLRHAADCVRAVEQGQSLGDALPRVPEALRPGVQALAFHVLRHLGAARAALQALAPRKPEAPVQALLHSALALLVSDEPTPGASYAPHTVVDQAVEAAKLSRGTQRAAGFVNAVLRRWLRERSELLVRLQKQPVARWNHPAWWIDRLRTDHPDGWEAVLAANNRPGPMTLRINRRQISRSDYQQRLTEQGLASRVVGEDGLELLDARPVSALPGFEQGWFAVQDAAAQMAAPLLLAGRTWSPADRVLDACAAPGGKTAHLLEHADLDLLALDVDARRCERIRENLQRLGLAAEVKAADAGRPADWWDGRPFDAILLDAPCTASGIVRRHPDVRWLRRPGDVEQLAQIQQTLLEALWPLLKPGGRLLYATCSVFRAEGASQVAAFLARHSDAVAGPAPGHLLPGNAGRNGEFADNPSGGQDGFFYARLDKRAP